MKRDMELIKKIMQEIEEHDSNEPIFDLEFDDYDQQVVYYHCHLLIDADLIEGDVDRALSGKMRIGRIYGLTWEGHEFLDAAKNEKVWKTVKEKITENSVSVPFSILKTILMDQVYAIF